MDKEKGLVARIAALLPDGADSALDRWAMRGDRSGTGSDRRARLALRIAVLRAGPKVSAPPVIEPVAVPPPPPPPPPPEPPPRKPAKVTISTLRLEDAALLLAAASEPDPPAAPVPPMPGVSASLADAAATLAALEAEGEADHTASKEDQ